MLSGRPVPVLTFGELWDTMLVSTSLAGHKPLVSVALNFVQHWWYDTKW